MTDPAAVGSYLRSVATHHGHGDGWTYTRDTGDLQHIRYRRDWTGRNSLWNRTKRAFNPKRLLGRDHLSRKLGFKWSPLGAIAWIHVSLRRDRNRPDGVLNGGTVITLWEEDGEYIEMVGPTIGEKIADFLEQEPESPHAIAIAAEMRRVQTLSHERRTA